MAAEGTGEKHSAARTFRRAGGPHRIPSPRRRPLPSAAGRAMAEGTGERRAAAKGTGENTPPPAHSDGRTDRPASPPRRGGPLPCAAGRADGTPRRNMPRPSPAAPGAVPGAATWAGPGGGRTWGIRGAASTKKERQPVHPVVAPSGFGDGLRPKHRLRLRFSRRRPSRPHRRYPARCRLARSAPRRRPRPRWWSSDAACSSRRSRRPARWR